MDITQGVRRRLMAMQDLPYRDFVAGLIPTLDKERIIGVRSPLVRSIAGEMIRDPDAEQYLLALPHAYLEENNLHAMVIAAQMDYARAMSLTEAFLPHIDNWATCDIPSPKVFEKFPQKVLERVHDWLQSPHPYTRRYAIGVLMSNFLEEHFSPELLYLAADMDSSEYYVNMMRAWYISMALVKQWEAALRVLELRRMDRWTHHKAIQKAVESFRISDERKILLRRLRYK